MLNERKPSSDAHPEVANLMQEIGEGEVAAGLYEFRASSREDLIKTVQAIDAAKADASIMVDDLTAATLGEHSEAICDLAVEAKVPVLFQHRGRVLQLALLEDWPPQR